MAAQKKRKHASTQDPAPQGHGIKSFAKIGKATGVVDEGQKKRKTAHNYDSTEPSQELSAAPAKNPRKRAHDTDEPREPDATSHTSNGEPSQDNDTGTPRSKRFKQAAQPRSPLDTPSKRTADLFRNMKLEKPAPIPFSLGAGKRAYDTPPDTPKATQDGYESLPKAVEDLMSLHTAFLSALSLYNAHNGTSSLVEVKDLLPLITKSWKKRAVSVDDLRMLLAIEASNEPSFELKDFGRAGVRLIKSQQRGRPAKRANGYVDEIELNARFDEAIQKRWMDWKGSNQGPDSDAAAFVKQLPLANIEKDESVEKAAPAFARGQQRLADMKASQAEAKHDTKLEVSKGKEQGSSETIENRGTSLLDRILAKQAHSASLPAGPTRDQLERKAALQRIEDISRVLDLLTAGRSRCSFSMQAMIQQIQQSLRNPMSKAEVEKCLDLMAAEITPSFVGLVRNGSVSGVVITKNGKIGSSELKRRIQAACEDIP